ncbi:MAG TPA: InlB B-repeat-containing protein [Haloplasmataceae bacterium]
MIKKRCYFIAIFLLFMTLIVGCQKYYTITFESNGGNQIQAITAKPKTPITKPKDPEKTGYTFSGWYTDSKLESPFTFKMMPNKNITLYAKWTINQYTITFNSNGGSLVTAITQDYNTDITKPDDPTKTNYTFNGWYVDSECTIPFTFTKMPGENITLYAKWISNKYTISFESNGGTQVDDIIEEAGQVITKPIDPTKTGYTFGGWYTDNAYTTPFTFDKMPNENITLYAKWNINTYTINFNSNGGTEINPITAEFNSSITKPIDPTKTGFSFGGWFVDSECTIPFTFTKMPGENITLYAKWLGYSSDLFISEYFEGTSNNKYIEIFNNTGKTIDLSIYKIVIYVNGATTPTNKLNLSGSLAHGDILVIYNNQANLKAIINSGGLPTNNQVMSFNGDDVIALVKNENIIDIFGKIGAKSSWTIGGVANASKDHTIIRKGDILNPTATFNPNEWLVLEKDDTSNIGKHEIGTSNEKPIEVVDKESIRKNIDEKMQDAVDSYYGEDYSFYLLPSIGNVNILVIPIQFPDDHFTQDELEMINYGFFGDGSKFETLKSYYQTSSYGKLNIGGDVLEPYTANYNYAYYEYWTSEYNSYASGVDLLIEEAIRYYLTNYPDLDLSKYDSENDGFIDGIHIVYSAPIEYNDDDSIYWAFQYYYIATSGEDDSDYVSWGEYEFDSYVFSSIDFFYENGEENAWTIIHETGHLLGLEDYYDYTEDEDNNIGGLGGADMMDNTRGDHNPFSKLLLDWIDPIVVEDSLTITINDFASSGDAIIITNNFQTIFDEYFILSYYTPTGLNESNPYFTESGLIMYHVNASLPNDIYNMYDYSYYFEYNNSDSPYKLIKIEEADGDDNISRTGNEANNSDLLQLGDSYTLKLYNNKLLCNVTVDDLTNNTITLTIKFY